MSFLGLSPSSFGIILLPDSSSKYVVGKNSYSVLCTLNFWPSGLLTTGLFGKLGFSGGVGRSGRSNSRFGRSPSVPSLGGFTGSVGLIGKFGFIGFTGGFFLLPTYSGTFSGIGGVGCGTFCGSCGTLFGIGGVGNGFATGGFGSLRYLTSCSFGISLSVGLPGRSCVNVSLYL